MTQGWVVGRRQGRTQSLTPPSRPHLCKLVRTTTSRLDTHLDAAAVVAAVQPCALQARGDRVHWAQLARAQAAPARTPLASMKAMHSSTLAVSNLTKWSLPAPAGEAHSSSVTPLQRATAQRGRRIPGGAARTSPSGPRRRAVAVAGAERLALMLLVIHAEVDELDQGSACARGDDAAMGSCDTACGVGQPQSGRRTNVERNVRHVFALVRQHDARRVLLGRGRVACTRGVA